MHKESQSHLSSPPSPMLTLGLPRLTIEPECAIMRDTYDHVFLDYQSTEYNIVHITSLERSVCMDYTCCGMSLHDFHALCDHVQDAHAISFQQSGRPVYSRDGLRVLPPSLSATPESSRASSVVSSPQTPSMCLPTPSTPGSSICGLYVTPVYTPFTPSLPIDPAYPYSDTDIPPPIHAFHMETETEALVLPSTDDSDMLDVCPIDSPAEEEVTGYNPQVEPSRTSVEIPRKTPSLKIDTKFKASGSSKSKAKVRCLGGGPALSARKQHRDKSYKCPTFGCTKAYLNPNGLKYHVEKGTCTFADVGLESSEGDANATDSMEEQFLASKGASSEPPSPMADPNSPHQPSIVSDGDSGLDDITTPENSQYEAPAQHDSSASVASADHPSLSSNPYAATRLMPGFYASRPQPLVARAQDACPTDSQPLHLYAPTPTHLPMPMRFSYHSQ